MSIGAGDENAFERFETHFGFELTLNSESFLKNSMNRQFDFLKDSDFFPLV